MPDMPGVSIIIPTRDTLTYLPAAIASIGADPRVEIIVVDDGSTDGTAAWLAGLARRDSRVVVLAGPGRGPARARNLGIAAARAPLVAFLDADDSWAPGKLAAQLALHRACPGIGFSFTDYRHVTPEGEDRGGSFVFWPRFQARHGHRTAPFLLGEDALAQLYGENVVGTSTVVARADLLREVGGFDEDMPSAEDWELWLHLAARAPVGCLPGKLADYLMHRPGNQTGQMDRRVAAMRLIGAVFRDRACALDRSAGRVMAARIMTARAELAHARNRPLHAAALQFAALLHQPTPRAARDSLAALLRPLRGYRRAAA